MPIKISATEKFKVVSMEKTGRITFEQYHQKVGMQVEESNLSF